MTAWPEGEPGVVALPSGLRVRGRALRAEGSPADLTVVLGARPVPGAAWVRWRDFRAPADTEDAVATLREVLRRAREERVEIVCRGGRGRTGTALAALLVLEGVPPEDAIRAVRRTLHPRAVETAWQRRWLHRLAGR